jgi:hypothetical protein
LADLPQRAILKLGQRLDCEFVLRLVARLGLLCHERGHLDPGAADRFAFYQLEHCLGVLGRASQGCPEHFARALWLIEHELDGARLTPAWSSDRPALAHPDLLPALTGR